MIPALYRKMLLIRMVEERLAAMCKKGEAGDLHFSRGQEAISVGVLSLIHIWSTACAGARGRGTGSTTTTTGGLTRGCVTSWSPGGPAGCSGG